MKRWLWRALFLCGALVALLSITGLIARTLVTGSSRDDIAGALSRRLGVPVSVGNVQFDLASWFLLRPTVSLGDIAIGNPPGFRARNLLTARRISARVALLPLLGRRLEMRSIRIDTPRMAVESDAHNATNIEAFFKKLSAPPPLKRCSQAEAGSLAAAAPGIDEVRVFDGEVLISGADAGEPPLRIGAMNLRVRGLSAGTNCRLELSGKLFGGGDSGFQVEGRAGPFGPQVLPIEGKLTLTIVPGEIPERIRHGQFGMLLGAPGEGAKATLEASIQGDLYNNVAGPARLALSGLQIGKDAGHRMRMDGDAPALFSAQKLLSAPAFHLQVLGAKLRLGEGEWAGAADFRVKGTTMSGASRGSIRGVDVNALLGSFTAEGGGRIYGVLDIPAYTLQFTGRTAREIGNSLDGTARLSVTKGNIAVLDLAGSIQQGASAAGITPFTTLTGELNVHQGRLELSAIAFDSPALKFTGNGTIGFDHSMHFDLSARVRGAATLAIVVAGTLDRPQVRRRACRTACGV